MKKLLLALTLTLSISQATASTQEIADLVQQLATNDDPAFRRQATLQLALLYGKEGEWQEGKRLAQEVADQHEDMQLHYAAHLHLGQINSKNPATLAQAKQSFVVVSEQTDYPELQAASRLLLAQLLLQEGEQSQAEELFTLLTQQEPHDLPYYKAHLELGKLALQVQEYTEAINHLHIAQETSHEAIVIPATLTLVQVHIAQDNKEQALNLLETIVQPVQESDQYVLHYYKGILYRQLQEPAQAIKEFSLASQSTQEIGEIATYELGITYFHQQQYTPAFKTLEQLLNRTQNTQLKLMTQVTLGRLHAAVNKIDRALAFLHKALTKAEKNSVLQQEIRLDIARCYIQQNKIPRAKKIVVELNQPHQLPAIRAMAQYLLAIVYIQEKKVSQARTLLQTIIQQHNNQDAVRMAHQLLSQLH